MADKSMRYRFLGEDGGLGKTMSGLGDKSDKLHLSLGKLAGGLAGGVVGAGAVDFLKTSISDASDLNESLSKTRVVFGSASKGVEAFAKAAATGIGQSQQEALEATSTFGNLFRALGIGAKPAADLSTKVVKLAGDLASFNNADPAEVLDALKSGLLGEAEPLRKFGVTLSQARVEAEALADGIVKPTKDSAKVRTALLNVEVATKKLADAQKGHRTSSVAVEVATKHLHDTQEKYGKGSLEAKVANDKLTKANEALSKSQQAGGPHSLAAKVAADNLARANAALAKVTKGNVPVLTAAQKAQASYNIIMKDTKTAQGDFARTSGGLANQQRILKAELADASAQLGNKLLPAATKVVAKLNDALKPGSKFRDVLSDLGAKAAGFADDAKPIFSWIGDHPDLFTQIAKDAVILGAALKARTFIMGLGLLKGAGGARLGGAAGGVVGKAGATPVYVTNPGFGAGGVGGGKTPPVVAGGGPKGPVLGAPLIIAAVIANKKVHPKNAAERVLDDPKTKKELGETPKEKERKAAVALRTARVGAAADRFLDDPKRGRAARNDVTDFTRGVVRGGYAQPVTKGDIVRLLTPGAKPSVTNNYYNINAYGADLNKVMAQAHRQARIHAVGSVNNAATRDRNG